MDVLYGPLLTLVSEVPLVACRLSLALFCRQGCAQSTFLFALTQLVLTMRLVEGVSFDPVIRREATENLFANGSESF